MKRFLCICVLIVFVFSSFSYAETDNSNQAPEETPVIPVEAAAEGTQNQVLKEQVVKWEAMNEMQIALMIISKQIDYLMDRIEDADNRAEHLIRTYEDRLNKEIDRNKTLIADYEEKITSQDTELKTQRDTVSKLERDMAIFASESGLYLKILIGFLAGTLAGVLLSGILGIWKRRGTSKNKE